MAGKTIIHQKYDMEKITSERVKQMHDMLKATLPEDYIVISTPTDITEVKGNDTIITIDAKPYTTGELMEIIEKAWKYDELNK